MKKIFIFLLLASLWGKSDKNFLKGEALYSQKKYSIAEDLLKKSLDHDPLNSRTYFYLANINIQLKDYTEADKFYQKCLDLDPKDVAVLYNYAHLKSAQKMYDVAEQLYLRSLRINSNFSFSYSGLARLYYKIFLWEKSADNFEKLLVVKPDHQDRENILKWIDYLRGHLDEAKQKRNELYPDEADGNSEDGTNKDAAFSIDVQNEGTTREMDSKKEDSIEDIDLDIDIVE